MTFAPHVKINRISVWRQHRYRKCFLIWAKILIPNKNIRSYIGRFLHKINWISKFARIKLGIIFFDRILTPHCYSKNTITHFKNCPDIKQIMTDNSIKDMHDCVKFNLRYVITNEK